MDNSRDKWMERFYPGKTLIEIWYDAEEFGRLPASVSGYEEDYVVDHIINPDEVVIEAETIHVTFRYPLSVEVVFDYTNDGGFTRKGLYRCIYEGYKKIFDEEEQEVGDPGIYERLYNRRRSEGKYGIWGHYMDDLWLEIIFYDPINNLVTLAIGS